MTFSNNFELITIGMPSSPIDWGKCYTKNSYPLSRTKILICVEAYKVLEQDFTAILSSCAEAPRRQPGCDNLRFAMTETAKALDFPIGRPNWWSELPFGIFAIGLAGVFDMVESTRRSTSLRYGKTLFYEVIDEGLRALLEDSNHLSNESTTAAIQYMKDRNNFELIVREWACIGLKRVDRFELSHRFHAKCSVEDRQGVLSFYQEILEEGDFTKNFQNVGLLSLIKLKMNTAAMERSLNSKNKTLEESLASYYG